MVVIIKPDAKKEQVNTFLGWVRDMGVETNVVVGKELTIVGLIGDTTKIDFDLLRSISIVDDVRRIQEPYKNANRKMHPEDTIIQLGERQIGEGFFHVIAGPCSVESREQIGGIAAHVKESGATFLRGGAFKPRTSPYAFQGMRAEGIELLVEAKNQTGLPIVTEIMSVEHLPLFEEVDIIQVGARNMQNFELLKELGHLRKPILLKRGLANTLEELLMSAEYIMAGGNRDVILCERGIRTFETAIRNTLDISAIPFLKSRSHLPVIIDPSHAAGMAWMVPALSRAAVAVGADGLIIEVHNDPQNALCDGAQSLRPEEFEALMGDLRALLGVMGKSLSADEAVTAE
ncbi:MAG: 3-deoxy-7-phosphoheptulonate synthase [Oscillospiraceae bacterium]|jgi:3-deoxy-7-phosphoheptulonate synthase|nr:3-deoxy-7-phosphoheptulonate synthase [Oscillospiraceae bacterium]